MASAYLTPVDDPLFGEDGPAPAQDWEPIQTRLSAGSVWVVPDRYAPPGPRSSAQRRIATLVSQPNAAYLGVIDVVRDVQEGRTHASIVGFFTRERDLATIQGVPEFWAYAADPTPP